MKKNRFIMKSALFALVLGFSFFNTNAARSSITTPGALVYHVHGNLAKSKDASIDECKKFYEYGIDNALKKDLTPIQIAKLNEKVDEYNTRLNKSLKNILTKTSYKKLLEEFSMTDDNFSLPHLLPFHQEVEALNKEYNSFVELLEKYNEEHTFAAYTIADILKKINGSSGVICVYSEERIAKMKRLADYTDCVINNAVEVDTKNRIVICDKIFEALNAAETLKKFKSIYSDLCTKRFELARSLQAIRPFLDKTPKTFTDLLSMKDSLKNSAKDIFFFLSYMVKAEEAKTQNVFKIDLKSLEDAVENEIILNKKKSNVTAPASSKAKPSSLEEDFKKLLEDDSAAPTAAKLTSVAVDEATTKVVTEEKTGDTLETKKEIKKITKKEVKKAPAAPVAASDAPAIAPAAGSDDDTSLTLADLEANYKELHNDLQRGRAVSVHKACVEDKTEFGEIYNSNKDLQRPIREAIDKAADLRGFFNILKADARFAIILSEVKNDDLLKEFMN